MSQLSLSLENNLYSLKTSLMWESRSKMPFFNLFHREKQSENRLCFIFLSLEKEAGSNTSLSLTSLSQILGYGSTQIWEYSDMGVLRYSVHFCKLVLPLVAPAIKNPCCFSSHPVDQIPESVTVFEGKLAASTPMFYRY